LTAETVLPPELAARQATYATALHEEIQPQSALEFIFVNEIARHAAALDVATGAEAAALRVASQSNELFASLLPAGVDSDDQRVIGAIGNEATERVCRYRRGHERALHGAIRGLAECRASLQHQESSGLLYFASEGDCANYLHDWQVSRQWSCPHCRHTKRCFLQNRQRFECQGCGTQHGLRSGTILERSRLPMLTWFRAILALVDNPSLQTADLADATRVVRAETLSMLHTKVLDALRSPHRYVLLAGLITLNRDAGDTCASGSKIQLPNKTKKILFGPNARHSHST